MDQDCTRKTKTVGGLILIFPIFEKILKAILTFSLICFSGALFSPEPSLSGIEASRKALAAFKLERSCMGSLLWYEARGEPLEAQRAVLDVALNRASAASQSICEVVKAPGQFQWTKHHNPSMVDKSREALVDSVSSHPRILTYEKFFFSISPAPLWTKSMVCHRIAHITFCKEKS